jgi:hypothetical protein
LENAVADHLHTSPSISPSLPTASKGSSVRKTEIRGMGVSSLEGYGLVRLCVVGEDKESIDVIVYEDDNIWTLKIKIFELINVFPGKQVLMLKNSDEVCFFHFLFISLPLPFSHIFFTLI